jgi:hypothetical protein
MLNLGSAKRQARGPGRELDHQLKQCVRALRSNLLREFASPGVHLKSANLAYRSKVNLNRESRYGAFRDPAPRFVDFLKERARCLTTYCGARSNIGLVRLIFRGYQSDCESASNRGGDTAFGTLGANYVPRDAGNVGADSYPSFSRRRVRPRGRS